MIPDMFHNLPVHALAVHGAVVFIPLAALLAILFAVRRTRGWAALPMAIVSVVALLNVYVARESGFNLKRDLGLGTLIQDHENKANVLFYLMIGFAIIAVVVYLLYRRGDSFIGTLEYAACGVLVVAALVVAFQTYRVGEAGARAVWAPRLAGGGIVSVAPITPS